MALAHQDHSFEGASTEAPGSTRYIHPDYSDIQLRVQEQERLLFGLPERGVFQAILATRESRLKGIITVVTGLPGYKTVPRNAEAYFVNAKGRTNSLQHKLARSGAGLQDIFDDPTSKLHRFRMELKVTNDPVIQTLHAIEAHQPPLREEDELVLAVDALHFALKHRKNLTGFPWSDITASPS